MREGALVSSTKSIALTLLILGWQTAAAQIPSAGSQLQQIPAPVAAEKDAPQLDIDPVQAPLRGAGDDTRVLVKSLRLLDAQ